MDISNCFAENLKELLFDNQIALKDICIKLDIDLSQCYRYFRKKSFPCTATVIKFADYFCCSIDYLLGLAPHLIDDKLNYTPPFSVAFTNILKEYNTTRYQLNKQLKIPGSQLDYWFHGTRMPTIESLMKLAKHFDCTIDKLLCREYR